jgi:quercetin dioxygenase-like cupin family protein
MRQKHSRTAGVTSSRASCAESIARPEAANRNRTIRKEPTMATKLNPTLEALEGTPFGRERRLLKRSVWYHGWLYTFLATGEDTEGSFTLIEGVAKRGCTPPPHIHHREDETYYVIEGQLTASVGEQLIKVTPGSAVFLPRDVAHSIVIDSDRVRVLILLTPAGLERYFKELSVPAPALTLPPSHDADFAEIEKMLEVSPEFGIEWVLPKELREC